MLKSAFTHLRRTLLLLLVGFSLATTTTADANNNQPTEPPFLCPAWSVLKSDLYPVAVWVCGDSPTDKLIQARMMGIIAKYWPEMVKLPPYGMGPPRGDATGRFLPASGRVQNNDELDFYILTERIERTDLRRYQGTTLPVDDPRLPDDPDPVALDGYPARALDIVDSKLPIGRTFVIVNRNQIGRENFERIIVHEMFHVLQYRWNPKVMFNPAPPDTSMFADGTTTWAETYYVRDKSRLTHFDWFSSPPGFQHRPELSLIDGGNQIYRTYIWFLFMEQELGSGGRNGQPIFQLWQQSENMDNFQQMFEAINRYFPFQTHFRDFAVRNFNSVAVLTSAGEKHYGQLDPNFPVDVLPDYIDSERLLNTAAPAISEPVKLRQLMAHYWQFDVSGDVKLIEVDLSNLRTRIASLDVDALVQLMPTNGAPARWERRKLNLPRDSFCLDEPKNRGLNRMVLIVSNHEHKLNAPPVNGTMLIRSNPDCGQLSGDAGVIYNAHVVNHQEGATEESTIHASINAHLTWLPPKQMEMGRWDSSGSNFVVTSTYKTVAGCHTTIKTTTASGPWDEPPIGNLEKDNVVLHWMPDTSYQFTIPKMKGFPGAPAMPTIPRVEYGGAAMPPVLQFHPEKAQTRHEESGCDAGPPDSWEVNGMTVPGCTLSNDESRPGLEGKVKQLPDGSYLIDFACSNSWTEESVTTKVTVTGKLPVKMSR